MLQDEDGQTIESHSISAGLDYPGVGPEHSWLASIGRAEYRGITDTAAMDAFALLSMTEGIMPAIESAHALAGALELGRELGPDAVILVSLSGRGDKDVHTASRWFGLLEDDETAATTADTDGTAGDAEHPDAVHDLSRLRDLARTTLPDGAAAPAGDSTEGPTA